MLIRVLKLEERLSTQNGNDFRRLQLKLAGHPILDRATEGTAQDLVLLYSTLLDQMEKQLFSEQLKRVEYEQQAKEFKSELKEQRKTYKEYVDSITVLIKDLTKKTSAYAARVQRVQEELVSAKRERDAAVYAQKDAELRLGMEQENKKRLRTSYRVLSSSIGEGAGGGEEVKDARNKLRNACKN